MVQLKIMKEDNNKGSIDKEKALRELEEKYCEFLKIKESVLKK